MHWFWGLQKRLYRGWVLLFALAFIELDIRKVITMELPPAAETQAVQAILDVFKEHFFVHFLLLPFYAVIVFFPVAAFLGRAIQKRLVWVVPIVAVTGLSYFITLEANIGLFLFWYRPGYQEVAFSMTLMPLALLIFLTLDARRIIRVVRARSQRTKPSRSARRS
ncbi:MAG: hypothetical protein RL333_1009 [Pseudomonadota bacterium]|jgi:heme exporter protein D